MTSELLPTIPPDVMEALAALDEDTLRRVFAIVLERAAAAGAEHKLTTSGLKWVDTDGTATTPRGRPAVRGLSPSRPEPEATFYSLREDPK